jgi:hypothetical protein
VQERERRLRIAENHLRRRAAHVARRRPSSTSRHTRSRWSHPGTW